MFIDRSISRRPRVALYSHDTLGFGHLRRNLLLARRLRDLPQAPDVLLIAGMREAGAFDLPEGVDLLSLPGYAKDCGGTYAARHLGLSLSELASLRSQTIRSALLGYKPDLVVVDNVPLGAQGELEPALQALRAAGETRIVLGLRDVIDDRRKVRSQWIRARNFETLREHYDQVWIYGDPGFYDPVAEYGLGEAIAAKTRYTGYLRRDVPATSGVTDAGRASDEAPLVLCTVGGGRDGVALAEAFARAALPDGMQGLLVTGTQMDAAAQDRIADLAARNPAITVVPFMKDLVSVMSGAERVIAMGGYNTICEILSLRRPALIVPRTAPRREQAIRAERLAAVGALDMLLPDDLTPRALTDWLAGPACAGTGDLRFDLNGLDRFAAFASEALRLAEIAVQAA
ncbi:glycosyltransferase family protein [Jannaschia aquimarina]|uniref:MurG_1 protein n=1 Tax=Jannaschia aquimarina TaxID=935700 RepID=A0A0D1DAC5_9RHOB|nr:glycosyltransferase [Jannaschia aquimarina]KIT16853.1 UDP-N-acetylglucosamine--N-acetylmuramyl-(pentapeptide) pyrophosphoryl-undecaprenol N-acetylglucosamine transferase [Jannaschia aquimarina]SNT13002.1 Predicted glycosyl transferase [Jannaschia aquimarina]